MLLVKKRLKPLIYMYQYARTAMPSEIPVSVNSRFVEMVVLLFIDDSELFIQNMCNNSMLTCYFRAIWEVSLRRLTPITHLQWTQSYLRYLFIHVFILYK